LNYTKNLLLGTEGGLRLLVSLYYFGEVRKIRSRSGKRKGDNLATRVYLLIKEELKKGGGKKNKAVFRQEKKEGFYQKKIPKDDGKEI